jgi:DNA-directed RNA polymerase specialized sigma24 family protein
MRERELVARARAGDNESWSELIAEHGAALWAAIHDCGLQGHDATSVWQTTWLSAAQQLDALPTASGLRRWLLAKAAVTASRVKLRNWAAEESATRGRVIALAVMPAANSADTLGDA